MDPSARRLRVARGVAASSAATLIALCGHVLAGGTVASPLLVVIPLVLCWLPGVALIGRMPALWRQAAVILPAQAALHAVFVASATSTRPMTDPHAMPGMHVAVTAPLGVGASHTSTAMWAGHALAALLTVLAWRHGERAVRTLARVARSALVALLLPAPPPARRIPASRVVPPSDDPVLPQPRVASRAHARRGPPSGLLLVS